MAPVVFVSVQLQAALSADELTDLVDEFRWWKCDLQREYESPVFGKDSKLVNPLVNGAQYVISHCHLMPKHDHEARKRWAREFRRRARKTSDRVLFYVRDGNNFYLVDIVDDPGAHEIMRMNDSKGRSFMLKCAEEARTFLDGRLAIAAL